MIRMKLCLLFGQILDRFPAVENIAGGTPHARAGFLNPFMRLICAPGACGKQDIPAAIFQRDAHSAV